MYPCSLSLARSLALLVRLRSVVDVNEPPKYEGLAAHEEPTNRHTRSGGPRPQFVKESATFEGNNFTVDGVDAFVPLVISHNIN